jgi:hypothetical protein
MLFCCCCCCCCCPLQAFAGINIADIDARTLLDIVTYHICPFKRMYRLLVRPQQHLPLLLLLLCAIA